MKRATMLAMATVAAALLGACGKQDTPSAAYDPNVDGLSQTLLTQVPDTSILADQKKAAPAPTPAPTPAATATTEPAATEAATTEPAAAEPAATQPLEPGGTTPPPPPPPSTDVPPPPG